MHVLVQTFFENSAAEVIGLPFHDLSNALTKFRVCYVSPLRFFGEPFGLEGTLCFFV